MKRLLVFFALVQHCPILSAADPSKPNAEPVELVGRVSDFWYSRNWSSYYWREDFTFQLTEAGSDKPRRIISQSQPQPISSAWERRLPI